MKTQYLILIAFLALYACGAAPADPNQALPDDLGTLTKLHKDKQEELRNLQKEIEEIENRISELDINNAPLSRIVVAQQLTRGDFKRYARIQGLIESRNKATVTTEVPGLLTSVLIEEGDNVNRGQLIATVDVESVQKQKAEMEKALELAREVYVRQERLWDQKIGSEIQYLEAKNSVERLEKSIESINHQLTKSKIYSPLTGSVDVVNLKAGEYAQPGMPIALLLDTRNVKVMADVPENYIGKVSRGERVTVTFPALGDTVTSPVAMVGRKIDPANRTFKIEVEVANTNNLLKPNLLAEVLINDYTEEDVVVISQELIQQEVGGRQFVMTVDQKAEGPVARKTYITTGETYNGAVVVGSGLEGNELLITKGARGLSSNEPIRLTTQEEAANE